MTHALIVDDLEDGRYLLTSLLQGNGYRVTAANDGVQALAAARRDPPDIVVSDALMPNMDGFLLCRAWMQDEALKDIPFVFYSATYTRADDERLALALGAARYLVKPMEPQELCAELARVLAERAGAGLPSGDVLLDEPTFRTLHEGTVARKLEHKIAQLEATNRMLRQAEEQSRGYLAQLQAALLNTVKVVMTLGEMRDPYTAGHERRVADIAVAIGGELGLDAHAREGLRVAGYLHDVGKIAVPSEILSKPGRLSPIEYQLIQQHAAAGYEILKEVEFPWPVAEVARQHHERLDGGGYPRGLKGDAILQEARIIAVADMVEAMSSHRPYRAAIGVGEALAGVERGRGSAFDPNVVDACLSLFRDGGYSLPA